MKEKQDRRKEEEQEKNKNKPKTQSEKWEGTSEHEIEQGKQAFLTHSSVYRSLSFALSILTLDGAVSTHPVLAASFLTIPDFAFWARQSIFFSKEKQTENPLGETPPM